MQDGMAGAYEDAPINFSYSDKINSQELKPIQRVKFNAIFATCFRRWAYNTPFHL